MSQFEISINKGSITNNEYSYKYKTNIITMYLSENRMYFRYSLKKQENIDKIIFAKNNYFIDALIKAYCCNLIKYNVSLKIKSIIVSIDGNSREYNSNPDFPFLLSVIQNQQIVFKYGQKDDIIQYLIKLTKTSMDKDPRYIILTQLLLSKTRENKLDKFCNLWASMNAFYGYISKTYTTIISRCDGDEMSQFMKHFNIGEKFPSKRDRDSEIKSFAGVGDCLEGISENQIEELYFNSHNNPEILVNNAKYAEIAELADGLDVSLFSFMLLVYPYYYRCKFLHGNKAPVLFYKKHDRLDSILNVMNYYLETFIEEKLDTIFSNTDH